MGTALYDLFLGSRFGCPDGEFGGYARTFNRMARPDGQHQAKEESLTALDFMSEDEVYESDTFKRDLRKVR